MRGGPACRRQARPPRRGPACAFRLPLPSPRSPQHPTRMLTLSDRRESKGTAYVRARFQPCHNCPHRSSRFPYLCACPPWRAPNRARGDISNRKPDVSLVFAQLVIPLSSPHHGRAVLASSGSACLAVAVAWRRRACPAAPGPRRGAACCALPSRTGGSASPSVPDSPTSAPAPACRQAGAVAGADLRVPILIGTTCLPACGQVTGAL
jgi:hypothetical protein